MILLVTGWFDEFRDGRRTGKKEFVVSHGVDLDTMKNVILPCEPPSRLGAVFSKEYNEWVLPDSDAPNSGAQQRLRF